MRKSLFVCAGLLLLFPLFASPTGAQKPDRSAVFMRAKLQHSQ